MQCWINGPATSGIDDKINPPAADHYFYPVKLFSYFTGAIFGANSEAPKNLYILHADGVIEIPRRNRKLPPCEIEQ